MVMGRGLEGNGPMMGAILSAVRAGFREVDKGGSLHRLPGAVVDVTGFGGKRDGGRDSWHGEGGR